MSVELHSKNKHRFMSMFSILALSDVASETGIEVVFRSFASFHHALTPKHKKKAKLIFIDKGGYALSAIQWAEKLEIPPHVQVLNWKRLEIIQQAYETASLLFLPARGNIKSEIIDALSRGIPVLSFLEKGQEQYIDQTCGTLIDYYSTDQSIEDFANVMRMLYFDPEACKLLRKGALNKYENQVNWLHKTEVSSAVSSSK